MKNFGKYVDGWKNKLAEREIRRRERYILGFSLAHECASRLFSIFKVKSVYLVGSLVLPGKYHLHSDIDLLVEGLPPGKYFEALSVCSRQLPDEHSLDLIRLEELNDAERKDLLDQGVSIAA